MKRPLRWCWAVLISYLAAHVVMSLWGWLTLTGSLVDQQHAPLEFALRGWMRLVKMVSGDSGDHAIPGSEILPTTAIEGRLFGAWFRVPFVLAALVVYAWLRRRKPSEYLRCLKCEHILKGLTEPRCPECGEQI